MRWFILLIALLAVFSFFSSPTGLLVYPLQEEVNDESQPVAAANASSGKSSDEILGCSQELDLLLGQQIKFQLPGYDSDKDKITYAYGTFIRFDNATGLITLTAEEFGRHTALVVVEGENQSYRSCLIRLVVT
jgi:hypothetical protein